MDHADKRHNKLQDRDEDPYRPEDLDLAKQIFPISHYVDRRREMLEQVFDVVQGPRLEALLPPVLKGVDLDELKERCWHHLKAASRTTILQVLAGKNGDQVQDPAASPNTVTEQEVRDNNNREDSNGKTLMELLELEMRARAIKALLRKSETAAHDDPHIPDGSSSIQDTEELDIILGVDDEEMEDEDERKNEPKRDSLDEKHKDLMADKQVVANDDTLVSISDLDGNLRHVKPGSPDSSGPTGAQRRVPGSSGSPQPTEAQRRTPGSSGSPQPTEARRRVQGSSRSPLLTGAQRRVPGSPGSPLPTGAQRRVRVRSHKVQQVVETSRILTKARSTSIRKANVTPRTTESGSNEIIGSVEEYQKLTGITKEESERKTEIENNEKSEEASEDEDDIFWKEIMGD